MPSTQHVLIRQTIQKMCEQMGVEFKDVMSQRRFDHLVDARTIIANHLRYKRKLKLREVAAALNKSNTHSISYYLTRYAKLMRCNDYQLTELQKRIS